MQRWRLGVWCCLICVSVGVTSAFSFPSMHKPHKNCRRTHHYSLWCQSLSPRLLRGSYIKVFPRHDPRGLTRYFTVIHRLPHTLYLLKSFNITLQNNFIDEVERWKEYRGNRVEKKQRGKLEKYEYEYVRSHFNSVDIWQYRATPADSNGCCTFVLQKIQIYIQYTDMMSVCDCTHMYYNLITIFMKCPWCSKMAIYCQSERERKNMNLIESNTWTSNMYIYTVHEGTVEIYITALQIFFRFIRSIIEKRGKLYDTGGGIWRG